LTQSTDLRFFNRNKTRVRFGGINFSTNDTRVDQKEISIALIRLSSDEKDDKTGNFRHSLPIDKR
jgi:hypothetical protein